MNILIFIGLSLTTLFVLSAVDARLNLRKFSVDRRSSSLENVEDPEEKAEEEELFDELEEASADKRSPVYMDLSRSRSYPRRQKRFRRIWKRFPRIWKRGPVNDEEFDKQSNLLSGDLGSKRNAEIHVSNDPEEMLSWAKRPVMLCGRSGQYLKNPNGCPDGTAALCKCTGSNRASCYAGCSLSYP